MLSGNHLTHIVYAKLKLFVAEVFCMIDTLRRQVNAQHFVSMGKQGNRMPSFSASQIQYTAVRRQLNVVNQVADKPFRFFVVPVFIEGMIITCVEPGFKPVYIFHTCKDS